MLLGIAAVTILFGYIFIRARQLAWPLILAVLLGFILMPVSTFLHKKLRFPRWLAAGVTLLAVVAGIVLIAGVIVYGIVSQVDELQTQVENGIDDVKDWLGDLELSDDTVDWVQSAVKKAWPDLMGGIADTLTGSVAGLATLFIGFLLGLFILFFLLNDDGTIKEWNIRSLPVSRNEAELIYDDVTASIRGYFKGTTIVAASNAVVVLPVLLIFRMPLIGATTFVIFVTGYIPSIGGYIGGAFAVFIALASKGLTAAIVMLVVLILANTVLQQPVQAWAYHKTLELHPLAALLVTIAGGIFFGIMGAILAVPLTAIVLKVRADLKAARAEDLLAPDP